MVWPGETAGQLCHFHFHRSLLLLRATLNADSLLLEGEFFSFHLSFILEELHRRVDKVTGILVQKVAWMSRVRTQVW